MRAKTAAVVASKQSDCILFSPSNRCCNCTAAAAAASALMITRGHKIPPLVVMVVEDHHHHHRHHNNTALVTSQKTHTHTQRQRKRAPTPNPPQLPLRQKRSPKKKLSRKSLGFRFDWAFFFGMPTNPSKKGKPKSTMSNCTFFFLKIKN
jgi:hypothetical protein